MVRSRELHWKLSKDKARRRIEKGGKLDDRDDLFGHIISKEQITEQSLEGNRQTLIVASSETTTLALVRTVWYLLDNPALLAALAREIPGAFKLAADIAGDSTASLTYLRTVIEEGLRMFPPIVHSLVMDNPDLPATIDGHVFPPGTMVASENCAMARDTRYWVDPSWPEGQ